VVSSQLELPVWEQPLVDGYQIVKSGLQTSAASLSLGANPLYGKNRIKTDTRVLLEQKATHRK